MGKTGSKKTVAVKGSAGARPSRPQSKVSMKGRPKASRPTPAPRPPAKSPPAKLSPAKLPPAAVGTKNHRSRSTPAVPAAVVRSPAPPAAGKSAAGKPAAAAKPGPPAKTTVATAKPVASVAKSAAAANSVVALKPAAMPSLSEARKDARASRAQRPVRVEPSKPEVVLRPILVMETANSSGDSKPKKNQAGLTVKELEVFRDLLLAKRRELVGDMSSMEQEALQSGDHGLSSLPIHMADMGTDNYNQEFTLGLVEKERTLLREINIALAKIQNGSYGMCEGSGKPIAKVRLEAQPWAKYSIEFARLQEKGPIRR